MNYKSLANKGRYGDSEIRNVAGRTSHVNPREADMIDLWGALGESLVQREGAGTRNPMTGMPEYHKSSWAHNLLGAAGHMNLVEGAAYVSTVGTVDISGQGEGSVVNWGGIEDPDDITLQNPFDETQNVTTDRSPSGDPSSQDPPYERGDPQWTPQEGDPEYVPSSLATVTTGDMEGYQDMMDAITSGTYVKKYDYNDDGVLNVQDINYGQNVSGDLDLHQEETITDWDDMTSAQFKAMIEQGRGGEIAEGFLGEDFGESDFQDVFDTSGLDFISDRYDLTSETLGSQKDITGGILQSNLESAKGQYGRGLQTAGYNVGKSLFDIKSQVEGQQSKGGFAGSGFIASTGKRAQRGLFQDYRAQQRELSAGLTDAKTAFKWGEQRMESDYQYGLDTARLGLETDIHDFWSDKYSDFYDRLSWLED